MKRHNQQTNFGFIRELQNSKNLANLKIGNFYGNAEESENILLRCIYYKKSANEFKLPTNTRRIDLTEYKNKKIVYNQKVKK
mgnify:CR=1 FL=1